MATDLGPVRAAPLGDARNQALAIADRTGATLIQHEARRLGLLDASTP
jgi:hypothetical protein